MGLIELNDSLKKLGEALSHLGFSLNTLPNYILFEMLHPHKKPRGSIRRNKKRRSKRNGETLS